VKGASGALVRADVTPNEYNAIRRVTAGTFSDGDYCLAIVTHALAENPEVHLFEYDDGVWRCRDCGMIVRAFERIAATFA